MSDWKPNHVPGEGPSPCDICLIGEAPGREENYRKRPFVGKTGQETEGLYLKLAGLERKDINIQNVIEYQPPFNKTPTDEEIAAAEPDVLARIEQINPKYIIACGYVPNRVFRDDKFSMEKIHGRVYSYINGLWGIDAIVVPTFHPAAGFRDGRTMHWCMEDFRVVGKVLRGEVGIHPEPTRTGEFGIVEGKSQLIGILEGAPAIAIDTEDGRNGPWSMQIATCPQAGWFIFAKNQPVIQEVFDWMYDTKPIFYVHHSIHDIATMEQIGFRSERFKGEVFDTMVKAGHRGDLPKGLKALVYRLLNEDMDDYSEVIHPAQNRIAIDYLRKVAEYQFPDLPKTKTWRRKGDDEWDTEHWYSPQNLTKRVQRLVWCYDGFPDEYIQPKLEEYVKGILRDYYKLRAIKKNKIWELWDELPTSHKNQFKPLVEAFRDKYAGDKSIDLHQRFRDMTNTEQAVEQFGGMPSAYLEDIELDVAVEYAARDAMNTFRVGELLHAKDNN